MQFRGYERGRLWPCRWHDLRSSVEAPTLQWPDCKREHAARRLLPYQTEYQRRLAEEIARWLESERRPVLRLGCYSMGQRAPDWRPRSHGHRYVFRHARRSPKATRIVLPVRRLDVVTVAPIWFPPACTG